MNDSTNDSIGFRCSNPYHPETAPNAYEEMTDDGFCPDCSFGEGILEPVTARQLELLESQASEGRLRHSGEIGLCCLLCDVSGSMYGSCFPPSPARRIDIIARAAAAGISDLYDLSNAADAYVAIIPFATSAKILSDASGKPFLKSVAEIRTEYPSPAGLSTFLVSALQKAGVGGGTDFNPPLALAGSLYAAALSGSLIEHGGPADFTIKTHDLLDSAAGEVVSVPNVRVLLYSDGGHYGSSVKNPFSKKEHSPLMTMFFGSAKEPGAKQMQSLACTCPQHGQPGYFLVDSPESSSTLRHLFRMASGTSGFCPECSRPRSPEAFPFDLENGLNDGEYNNGEYRGAFSESPDDDLSFSVCESEELPHALSDHS